MNRCLSRTLLLASPLMAVGLALSACSRGGDAPAVSVQEQMAAPAARARMAAARPRVAAAKPPIPQKSFSTLSTIHTHALRR